MHEHALSKFKTKRHTETRVRTDSYVRENFRGCKITIDELQIMLLEIKVYPTHPG
jgi:hypothetical protein